jgi:hypothetical protein
VLAWYYNGEYLWSQNEPAQFGPGNGFLLLVDANPQEFEYPPVPDRYFRTDGPWRYYEFDQDAQSWLEQNYLDVMCFQRRPAYFPVDLDAADRARCGQVAAPPGEAVRFGARPLMFGYTLANELLPGEDRERFKSMTTLFDTRLTNGEISYRLYDRLLRNAHSADAPFSLERFDSGLQFYRVGEDNQMTATRAVGFEGVSAFSDSQGASYMNPHLPFGSASVPSEGMSFQLAAPGDEAPPDARVKVYFTWDR